MVKKLQNYEWPAILGIASASTTPAPSAGEAPRFQPSKAKPISAAAIPAPEACVDPLASSESSPLPSSSTVAKTSATSSCQDSSFPVMPASFQSPAVAEPATMPEAGVGTVKMTENASLAADPFHAIQDRLRRLGATYYLLESWGNDQQLYRFYCKMAIGGSSNYTRCFESTNADPLQAMTQVLRQVEEQHSGVGQNGRGMTN
jgi:hypothetical protein